MALVAAETKSLPSRQTVIVRSANASDSIALLKTMNDVLEEQVFSLTGPEEMHLSPEQEAQWIESMNAHPSHLLLVAEIEGTLVGMLDFTSGHRKRIAHTGEFGMSVSKAHRGQGIGSFLLEVLLTWAKKHPQIEKVSLKVHANNQRAIHLYKKFGFKEEGRLKNDLKYSEDDYVDTVVMSREA